jgi:O-antigen/teichoic acid export membrane protein
MILYGKAYSGAAMVVTLAPLVCLPKAFLNPGQSLLQSNERQSFLITSTIVAGLIDFGVAWCLIPYLGAVGAAIGSGAAQLTAVGLMWGFGIYLYKVKLPWVLITKVAFISLLASLTAHYIALSLHPVLGVLLGGSASLIVLFGLFYAMRVLEPEDGVRLNTLTGILPKRVSKPANRLLMWLVRPAFAR